MNFKKTFPILLTLLLFLTDGIRCNQHQSVLAFLYHQKLSAKQKNLIGGTFGFLAFFAIIAYIKKSNSKNNNLTKSHSKYVPKKTNEPLGQTNITSVNKKVIKEESIQNNNLTLLNNYINEKKTVEDLVSFNKQVIQKSKNFYRIHHDNIMSLESHRVEFTEEIFVSFQEASLIMPQKLIFTIEKFITYKIQCGTETEKNFYSKEFDIINNKDKKAIIKKFIIRLLTKRPLVFTESTDCCTLMDETRSSKDAHKDFFENLQDDSENIKLYITYDEMLISAFLGLWTPNAQPFNDGSRNNCGDFDSIAYEYYQNGVGFAGLVGPRLEKPYYMEYKHIIIDREQNTAKNGYGRDNKNTINHIWAQFYDIEYFPLYKDVDAEAKTAEKNKFYSDTKYLKIFNTDMNDHIYFNVDIYKKRMRIMYENYMEDVFKSINGSTKHKNKKILFYFPGLGCGAWARIKKEGKLYCQDENNIKIEKIMQCLQIDLFIDLIVEKYLNKEWFAGVELGYFGHPGVGDKRLEDNYICFQNNSKLKKYKEKYNGLNCNEKPLMFYTLHKEVFLAISQRNPFGLLPNEYGNKENIYLNTVFPWDSNAPVGNEGSTGSISATSDPAAACSVKGGGYWLLNPLINPYLPKNIEEKIEGLLNAA